MNFFLEQRHHRRRGLQLTALFVLAVLSAALIVDLWAWCLYWIWERLGGVRQPAVPWTLLWKFSLVQLGGIAAASLWRIARLRSGGSSIALGLGATPVPVATDNPAWRRLRNVVEEIAIASGVPLFNVFVLEDEPGINAFAAGYSSADAAICVTQGCLEFLSRDEMQGVIAHEFSHVLNGDMRRNIILMGWLWGILGIGVLGHRFIAASMHLARPGRDPAVNLGPALMLVAGVGCVAYGAAGSFCGRLVQAAVARSRESLADASAVQFTRQTGGIAGALKKIAALRESSRLLSPQRAEVAHMALGKVSGGGWFATHPPLRARLKALGARWDEAELRALAEAWRWAKREDGPLPESASIAGFVPAGGTPPPATPGAGGTSPVPATATPATVAPLLLDEALLRRVPAELREMAGDPAQARGLLLHLLLDRAALIRGAQRKAIERALGAGGWAEVEAVQGRLLDLNPLGRLPLAMLAFPALRRRPRPELRALVKLLDELVRADGRIDVTEYCLLRTVSAQMRDLLDPSGGFRPGTRRLFSVRRSYTELCAILAAHGHPDRPEAAQHAFAAAMNHALPGQVPGLTMPVPWQKVLDHALDQLDRLRLVDKELVLEGVAAAIGADGVVTIAESELLRTICVALHSPLPVLKARLVSGR